MQHDEFIGQVQARARLASRGDAERATRVVLETLRQRLAGGQPGNLGAELPPEIALHLNGEPGDAKDLSLDDFFAIVSREIGVDPPQGIHQARAVISVLSDAVSDAQIENARQQLPEDWAPLFDSGSEGTMNLD